jgi:5'-nucleotidase
VRILVTNDDGIDSVGLHLLARAMLPHGEVTVVAPDTEYSGASAAFGALHLMHPEVHRARIEGIDTSWAVSGPPGLCIMLARLGAFNERFDLVVSGINPGANVGRSVYHSGTIGACLTARNGGISGVAVSQAVTGFGIEGQGWDEMLLQQQWDSAGAVASAAVGALVRKGLPTEPVVLNLNVPNLPLDEIKGWRRTHIGAAPPRAMAQAVLEPKLGYDDSFYVRMSWGETHELPEDTDGGAVMAGYVSATWLGRIHGIEPEGVDGVEDGIGDLLGR